MDDSFASLTGVDAGINSASLTGMYIYLSVELLFKMDEDLSFANLTKIMTHLGSGTKTQRVSINISSASLIAMDVKDKPG